MPKHTLSSPAARLLLILAVAWVPLQVGGVPVENLYVAEVLVPDESARQLQTGARAGLLQVLVRVSGSLDVEQSRLIRDSLRDPAAYYNQFAYESTDKSPAAESPETQARLLRLHFDPGAVARLLRDANLPVWGGNRPDVLVWVAFSDGQDRRILGEAEARDMAGSLIERGAQRGLPLRFPILDLEDASRIGAAEIWGAFLDRVALASARYNPDAILTARIQPEPGGRWSARWSYRSDRPWESAESASSSLDGLMRDMIDRLTDHFAGRFALGSSRGAVRLVVEDVAGVFAYAALSRYLEQLTPVLNSSIVALEGEVAEFHLETEGQYQQLVEIIELDERLLLLGREEHKGRLRYRWAPGRE